MRSQWRGHGQASCKTALHSASRAHVGTVRRDPSSTAANLAKRLECAKLGSALRLGFKGVQEFRHGFEAGFTAIPILGEVPRGGPPVGQFHPFPYCQGARNGMLFQKGNSKHPD